MQPLRLSGNLSEGQWRELIRLRRRWYSWPLRVIGDAHAYAFLYVAATGVLAVMLYPSEFRTRLVLIGIAASFTCGVVLLGLTHLLRRRILLYFLHRYNRRATVGIIRDDGVVFPDSRPILKAPWSSYQSAILTSEILIFAMTKRRRRARVFCIEAVSPIQREELLACLRHNLGPGKTKEAPIRRSRLRPNVIRWL